MAALIEAKDAIVWINDDTKQVMVRTHQWGCPEDRAPYRREGWYDPIGAAYSEWQRVTDKARVHLMLETAIDLAMQGYDLGSVLRAFASVRQFRELGGESQPMCRALTSALVGQCLEMITLSFEELLVKYGPEQRAH
jgi:hypothetical protein